VVSLATNFSSDGLILVFLYNVFEFTPLQCNYKITIRLHRYNVTLPYITLQLHYIPLHISHLVCNNNYRVTRKTVEKLDAQMVFLFRNSHDWTIQKNRIMSRCIRCINYQCIPCRRKTLVITIHKNSTQVTALDYSPGKEHLRLDTSSEFSLAVEKAKK